MMEQMTAARGGSVCAMDERYCIDNGAMIAYAGVLEYLYSFDKKKDKKVDHGGMNMMDCTFTQRFRTDEVLVTWRDD